MKNDADETFKMLANGKCEGCHRNAGNRENECAADNVDFEGLYCNCCDKCREMCDKILFGDATY